MNESGTDFSRLDAMSDDDIDFSDLPEVTPEMFARAVVRRRQMRDDETPDQPSEANAPKPEP